MSITFYILCRLRTTSTGSMTQTSSAEFDRIRVRVQFADRYKAGEQTPRDLGCLSAAGV